MRGLWTGAAIALSVFLVCAALVSSHIMSAGAATPYVVTSTADADTFSEEANCIDPATDPTHCTLRAAITIANANPGPDEIDLDPTLGTYTITIPGIAEDAKATGDFDITGDLTINGDPNGTGTQSIIDGNFDRAFDIRQTGTPPFVPTVSLKWVKVIGGETFSGASIGPIAIESTTEPLGNGGGIYNAGNLTIDDSIISGNKVFDNNGFGGGIYNESGTVILNGSTVSTNNVGAGGFGGGIYNASGNLTLNGSTVNTNNVGVGGFGGGIYNASGAVSVLASSSATSLIKQNSTGLNGGGGGIDSAGGSLTIDHSSVQANKVGNGSLGAGVNAANTVVQINNNAHISGNGGGAGSSPEEGGGIYSSGEEEEPELEPET